MKLTVDIPDLPRRVFFCQKIKVTLNDFLNISYKAVKKS